jgi:DEAD/DEAH box helicase domain-containing protein
VTTLAAERVEALLQALISRGRADRVRHVHRSPERLGRREPWPGWVPELLVERWAAAGIPAPWAHQVTAAQALWAGRSVVLATGTASGKSLAYLMPALSGLITAAPSPTVLYLAPTKALAADQLSCLADLHLGGHGLRPALFDGDTPYGERDWIRAHANYLLTNPDMLNRTLLPDHARWARFLGALRYVVVDECHSYRGVFGSHVAQVLRRLRRLCGKYGAEPVFGLCSATVSDPAVAAGRLTSARVEAVSEDTSPRAAAAFALWEPPLTGALDESGAPRRRTAVAEAADLLTDLVLADARVLAFLRSRRSAEVTSVLARDALGEVDPTLSERVAAYRGGYLPEERRELEQRLRTGELCGLAATNALELGIDITGLDAVLLAGYPGTRASMWQQAGRAGRAGQGGLAVFVARDDPLDTYLVHHPEALFGRPVEATVLDPDNPYVLAPHLCAAAAEAPLTPADLELFGPRAAGVVEELCAARLLRRRGSAWYWTRLDPAALPGDIRGSGGPAVRLVEAGTGRLLGTVDAGSAHGQVHTGAVHLHQGRSYVVEELDLDAAVAVVSRAEPDWTTTAREITEITVLTDERCMRWGAARVHFGSVEVTSQVVSYLSKRIATGEVFAQTPLDLPPRRLQTSAVWWTLPAEMLDASGIAAADVPGAAHAAEHAAIGLLPLFATCDRWDIGGVSTALHPDTGLPTVFVHDGHPGGAGFAERGFAVAQQWLRATRELIVGCGCLTGCPSCVQSPKCGNGNRPLDKRGAVTFLDAVLRKAT